MAYLRSALLACGLFAALAVGLAVFWAAVLGIAMAGVWRALEAPWDQVVGVGLLALAVVSGLVLYAVLLARAVRATAGAEARVSLHLATSGLVPVAAAALLVWYALASMRLGW
jgi:hypothetical protein